MSIGLVVLQPWGYDMSAVHHLKTTSDFIKSTGAGAQLVEELFRTVDESVSYELEVASGVTAAQLPGFGSGDAAIGTIQTFLFTTDTTVVLNWNGANNSLVVATGDRFAVFMVWGVSTTTVPTITNSGSTTANIRVLAGGT